MAKSEFDDEKSEIDGQDDDAAEVGARQKRSGKGLRTHIDGARTKRGIAIRADSIVDSNEGPAVGAHSPFFHGLIVAGKRKGFERQGICAMFQQGLLKSNSHG
jgi:hypothetical protein